MGVEKNTTLWAATSLVATAIGSLFFLIFAHAGEPTHPGAAEEEEVVGLQVRVERVAVDVENNKVVLGEVKEDIRELQVEQRASTENILRAIREIR